MLFRVFSHRMWKSLLLWTLAVVGPPGYSTTISGTIWTKFFFWMVGNCTKIKPYWFRWKLEKRRGGDLWVQNWFIWDIKVYFIKYFENYKWWYLVRRSKGCSAKDRLKIFCGNIFYGIVFYGTILRENLGIKLFLGSIHIWPNLFRDLFEIYRYIISINP